MLCFVRYVEEHIQRTGVAIETQGFSFVTSGRKRESLTVSATMRLLKNMWICGPETLNNVNFKLYSSSRKVDHFQRFDVRFPF